MKILEILKSMPKKQLLLLLLIIFIVLVIVSSFLNNRTEYETATIKRRTITQVVEASGTINPVNTVSVGSTVSGLISAIYVDFNSKVTKGQLLAEIDPRTFQATVDQNLASMNSAQADLDNRQAAFEMSAKTLRRYQNLYARSFIPKSELDQAEADYKANLAQVNAAKARINQTRAQYNQSLVNLNYTKNIDFAYELILKNHAHDSIYGCSTDKVHKNVDMRFEKANEILEGLEKRIVRDFHKNTKKPHYIGVFNMSNFKSSGVVKVVSEYKIKNAQIISKTKGFCDSKLYDINQVPVTEDILTLYEQIIETDEQKPMSFKTQQAKKPVK